MKVAQTALNKEKSPERLPSNRGNYKGNTMKKYNTLKSWSTYKADEMEKEYNALVIGKAALAVMACYGLLFVGLIF